MIIYLYFQLSQVPKWLNYDIKYITVASTLIF